MQSRRNLLGGTAAVGLSSLAGCTGLLGGGNDGDPASPAVAEADPPPNPQNYRYATTGGTGSQITYYGNWKCPYCAEFSNGSDRVLSLGTIIEEYIQPGDAQLVFRALAYRSNGDPFLGADAPRAARAGLAVWNEAPDRYWSYHETIMAEQPPEDEAWATVDRLIEFADSAGITSLDAIRSALETNSYQQAVTDTTERASEVGVTGTPTLVINGDPYSPFEPDQTRSALDSL